MPTLFFSAPGGNSFPEDFLKKKIEEVFNVRWLAVLKNKLPVIEIMALTKTHEFPRDTALRVVRNLTHVRDISLREWELLGHFSGNGAFVKYLASVRLLQADTFVLVDRQAVFFLLYQGNACCRLRVFVDRKVFNTSKGEARFLCFLRDICHMSLCRTKGILLHASGVVHKQKAYLFLGKGQSGKSTICSLAGNRQVIHDDIIGVYAGAKTKPVAYSLMHQQKQWPLGGIFFIRQAKENKVESLGYSDALKEGLRNFLVWRANFSVAGFSERKIDMVLKIFRRVPSYMLYFRKEPSFWRLIENLELHPAYAKKEA